MASKSTFSTRVLVVFTVVALEFTLSRCPCGSTRATSIHPGRIVLLYATESRPCLESQIVVAGRRPGAITAYPTLSDAPSLEASNACSYTAYDAGANCTCGTT